MECIYYPDLREDSESIKITGSEAKHLRALRLNINEAIMVSNGDGLCAKASIQIASKTEFLLKINETQENYGERKYVLALALGILSARDRFEFALEKSIELGITDFYPLKTDFSQRPKLNQDRLLSKSIAAMKQCKRSKLTEIHFPYTIENLLRISRSFDTIVVADVNGDLPKNTKIGNRVLVVVGPEGGFSDQELQLLKENEKTVLWNLGERRLRAETAAVVSVGVASLDI
jgi:16S rRNA (uracil1498-N3)-methyltransferase